MATDGFSKLFTKTNMPVNDLEEIIIGGTDFYKNLSWNL